MKTEIIKSKQPNPILKEYLIPMYNILDYKNIKYGVKTKLLDNNDKNSLSDLNKAILRLISHVYFETLFLVMIFKIQIMIG